MDWKPRTFYATAARAVHRNTLRTTPITATRLATNGNVSPRSNMDLQKEAAPNVGHCHTPRTQPRVDEVTSHMEAGTETPGQTANHADGRSKNQKKVANNRGHGSQPRPLRAYDLASRV